MIPDFIIDQARTADCIAIASKYSQLRKCSVGEMEGPCPKCGGTKRLKVRRNGWFCRDCYSLDKGGWKDAIELIRWSEGVDFMTAVSQLTNWQPDGKAYQRPTFTPRQPVERQPEPQSPDWIQRATAVVSAAQRTIFETQAATDYLFGRGLSEETIRTFGLGYRPDAQLPNTWHKDQRKFVYAPQPAILFPWLRDGVVAGIRYRFLTRHTYTDSDGKARTEKQCSQTGSQFGGMFFGQSALAGCMEDKRTLVLVEGELNHCSIWQVANAWKFDVLSLGSESATLNPDMLQLIRSFGRVIIWMDKCTVAQKHMALIPGSVAICSEDLGGMDANDCLQAGSLGAVLANTVLTGYAYRQEILYDLMDAHQVFGSQLDAQTVSVVNDWAKKTGLNQI